MFKNPLAVINYAAGLEKKRYDDYAERLKAARNAQFQQMQSALPSKMERLADALLAAGRPNQGRSNWESLRQGAESWDKSGEAARQLAAKQQQLAAADEAERAKAQFEMGGEREKLLLKYGEPPKQTAGYTSQTQIINGEPYVVNMPKDPSSGLPAYAVGPNGKRIDLGPQGAPAPGATPATPAQAGAVAAGARPTGKPISQAEFLALPEAQRVGVEFVTRRARSSAARPPAARSMWRPPKCAQPPARRRWRAASSTARWRAPSLSRHPPTRRTACRTSRPSTPT
jgi:hypothetical protein